MSEKKLVPQMGDLVRDRISHIEGIVTAKTSYVNMCDRYSVQPRIKPGEKMDDLPKSYAFDGNDLTVLERNAAGLSDEELARFGGVPALPGDVEEKPGGPPERVERF